MWTRRRKAKTRRIISDVQPGFSDMLCRKDDYSWSPNMRRQRMPSEAYETRQMPIVMALAFAKRAVDFFSSCV